MMEIAVIATENAAGIVGGAERFYGGLVAALNELPGIRAQRVDILSDESSFDAILESYLRFYDADLSRFDGIISTKAPGYVIRHPNHVCYLQHTMRVFYDMFDREFPDASREQRAQAEFIRNLDTAALTSPGLKKVYAIGYEVAERMVEYNGVSPDVLYQGMSFDGFRCGNFDYVLAPGRLHRWKRVDLLLSAWQHLDEPIPLRIVGDGEDGDLLREQAGRDERIEFVGRVSDERLIDLYADALLVPFVTEREDFGLITLEAFCSGKPVLACCDSGEPARIVEHGRTGFVVRPNPRSIARKIALLWHSKELAREMGLRGLERSRRFGWRGTAARLAATLRGD